MTHHLFRARRAAFSLVELLVVIAIIALIVAIIVPTLGGVRTAARKTATATLLKTVNDASSQFQADERRAPGYFSAAAMGSSDNATRGFTAMENVLLDLAGGIQAPGTNPGKIGSWIRVGPTTKLADQVWIDPGLIGAAQSNSKAYFLPTAKNFVLQSKSPKSKAAKDTPAQEDFFKLPDLVDSFSNPILAWVENEGATQTVTTTDDFAQVSSSQTSKPPARFYWNANAAFLNSEALGKMGKSQADSLLVVGSDSDRAKALAAFLGNPGFPSLSSPMSADLAPAAARGKIIYQSAGADGIYLSKWDSAGKAFGTGSQMRYGHYFSPSGNPSTNPYLDESGKNKPNDFIKSFDDILDIGGS